MPDETTLLADECAAEARTWLATVADIASGAAPESAIPLLLLTTSQIQLVGARLGAIADVVLEERFEQDPGPDTELDPLRVGLAHLLEGVDDYADVIDPVETRGIIARLLDAAAAEGRLVRRERFLDVW